MPVQTHDRRFRSDHISRARSVERRVVIPGGHAIQGIEPAIVDGTRPRAGVGRTARRWPPRRRCRGRRRPRPAAASCCHTGRAPYRASPPGRAHTPLAVAPSRSARTSRGCSRDIREASAAPPDRTRHASSQQPRRRAGQTGRRAGGAATDAVGAESARAIGRRPASDSEGGWVGSEARASRGRRPRPTRRRPTSPAASTTVGPTRPRGDRSRASVPPIRRGRRQRVRAPIANATAGPPRHPSHRAHLTA